ncbi:hypothetical protein Q9189_003872 [Teloschistes chrysophthalmus]
MADYDDPMSISGSQPISVSNSNRSRPRRESLAGSMLSGMSFGGISVGSFVRDEIIMTGSSPFPQHTPSYHSSSYIPKLEANFMKDFVCCGRILPSLHDLCNHFEQYHAEVQLRQPPVSDTRAAIASNTASAVLQNAKSTPVAPPIPKIEPDTTAQHHPSLDMDAVQDMEMDYDYDMKNAWGLPQSRISQFGQPSMVPPLDTKGHQGLRKSTPTTPVTGNGTFNPTVSSVNTPTLIAHPSQKQQWATPDSSAPGTPDPRPRNQFGFQFGNGNDMLDLCIDDPAKSLFSTNGGFNASTGQLTNAQLLGDVQYSENSELAKTIREAQRLAGIPEGGSGPNDGVWKPFHCPVIGCEKAYKNQNGLKYHKAHGHNNQVLHDNGNGTFSIVDPETMNPYPGTEGMEKLKPYKCDKCGKRYKNLNGLKYHENHSPPCKPKKESEASDPPVIEAVNFPQSGFGVNTSNGFLTGIDEDMVM